ncbi:hypothetical protein SB775_06985 [Peribacillus sp. SIMBA_075]|uniref:hypothetical protein n=1 Tax=Peribacillus sp. SIMBA_075 TaxID=3085813 RepID=UPI00397B9CD3
MWITNYESFWDSFWAGLISGTIYSLIVGIIVGLVIWNFQKNAETRQVERQSEREFSVFIQSLWVNLNLVNSVTLGYSFNSFIPVNIKKSMDLIKESPISYWNHTFNENHRYKKITESIIEIQEKYNEYTLLSNKLDNNLLQILKPRFANSPELKVIVALVNNIDEKTLIEWGTVQEAYGIKEYSEQHKKFLDTNPEDIYQYHETINTIQSKFKNLKDELITS